MRRACPNTPSLRASSPIWASETSLARTRERACSQGKKRRTMIPNDLAPVADFYLFIYFFEAKGELIRWGIKFLLRGKASLFHFRKRLQINENCNMQKHE